MGGLHNFMQANPFSVCFLGSASSCASASCFSTALQWPRGLLTDSGGFQMVSLLELAKVTDRPAMQPLREGYLREGYLREGSLREGSLREGSLHVRSSI